MNSVSYLMKLIKKITRSRDIVGGGDHILHREHQHSISSFIVFSISFQIFKSKTDSNIYSSFNTIIMTISPFLFLLDESDSMRAIFLLDIYMLCGSPY